MRNAGAVCVCECVRDRGRERERSCVRVYDERVNVIAARLWCVCARACVIWYVFYAEWKLCVLFRHLCTL